MTSSLTVAWIRGPSGALFSGAVKGSPALTLNGVANMSSGSRPQSETSRKSKMTEISGNMPTVPVLTAMRRGGGFRSSFSGKIATVFGATGSLGKIVCNRLGQQGSQIVIPYRGDPYEVFPLKVCGDLGQVLFHQYEGRDDESIRTAMKHSDIVINMIGREWETRNYKFKDVNVDVPRRLARIARESGIKTFIHISHINAREHPASIWSGGSQFLKTKWDGENAVFEEFPDATIFRPSDMIGFQDHFINYYMSWLRTGFRFSNLPLWKKGNYCIKQPISYTNVADAIMMALDNPSTKGKIIEATGLHRYQLSNLLDYMNEQLNRTEGDFKFKRTDIRLDAVPVFKALFMQNIRLGQKWTSAHTLERLERTQLSDESEGLPNLSDIGVEVNDISNTLVKFSEAHRKFRSAGYNWSDRELYPISKHEEEQLKMLDGYGRSMLKALRI